MWEPENIMTNTLNTLALTSAALLSLGLGATAASAAPASSSAVAKAKVLKQLTIVNASDLDFGTIVPATTASTVAISAAGTKTCGTGVTCTGGSIPASFTVTGTNNETVNVSIPASVVLKSGANTMTVDLSAAPKTLALGNAGNSTGASLKFGGTLSLAAAQADGVYQSDAFTVTVDYQ